MVDLKDDAVQAAFRETVRSFIKSNGPKSKTNGDADPEESGWSKEARAKTEGWVLTNPDVSHLNPNAITKAFKALRERFNMPDAPLHGWRHTHATLLLEEGIEREVVQKRLGHASIVVTSDIYSHITRRLQRKAAEAFEEILVNE